MGFDHAPPTEDDPQRERRWVVIAILVMVHLGLAATIAFFPFPRPNYSNRPLIGFILGVAFSQVSLTAAWCALGPGRFFVRVPLALMAASFSGLSLAAYMLKTSPNSNDFWFSVALVLAGWFCLQPPLWLINIGLKYFVRLSETTKDKGAAQSQFTLAHMLLWTLGVSLLLGIGRMAMWDVQVTTSGVWRSEETVFFVTFLVVNFLLAIPVVVVVLGLISPLYRILIVTAWSLFLGGLECTCLALVSGMGIPSDGFALIMLLNLVHGTALGGSLFALTALGYRLRREANPPSRAVG